MSRHQICAAHATLGRDLQTGSRHRFSCPTPKPGRDFIFPGRDLLELHLCRDIVFMSRPSSSPESDFQVMTPKSMLRPPTLPPMSRHQIHVATPFLPNQSRPGHDFIFWSRPHANQTRSYPAQPGRDTHFWSRP